MNEPKQVASAWLAVGLLIAGLALMPILGPFTQWLIVAAFISGAIGWRQPAGRIVCIAVVILAGASWLAYYFVNEPGMN